MSLIVWDKTGEREFETGVDHGVLYPIASGGTYPLGVGWNGLTAVNEKPSGADVNKKYADNINYANLTAAELFGATVEAYMYPDEFGVCDGTASPTPGLSIGQQGRKAFGLAYRTKLGNDVDGQDHGYKLHLVYNALAAPSEKNYETVNDSPDAITFSWELTTTPVITTGYKPTATITIDSTKVDSAKLAALEKILYGADATVEPAAPAVDPRLPLPDEVITLMKTT